MKICIWGKSGTTNRMPLNKLGVYIENFKVQLKINMKTTPRDKKNYIGFEISKN